MRIEAISKTFSDKTVIDSFSLSVAPGTITCISGPSGCGKTTLLNIVAGLESPESGTVTRTTEESGSVSYLFQEPRLLPWKTALENVSIVLGGNEAEAARYLELVGLKDHMDKYPSELSGGMRQRVAMARAFAYPSGVLLMDEPFQNLDTALRSSLLKTFLELWSKSRKTVLWVTHDITEACLAADDIVCVSSSPMRISRSFHVDIDRSERTAENTAALSAQIYETLVS